MSPVDGLVRLYEATSTEQRDEGRGWYDQARELCRQIGRGRIPVETVARVMAALSPRVYWATNVAWTEQVVAARFSGHMVPSVSTTANRRKAWAELDGEDALSGQKTKAFAAAIAGDTDAVVIDSWILRAVGLAPTAKVTRHRQRWITAAFTEAARIVGETPRDFQAIVWCSIRGTAA